MFSEILDFDTCCETSKRIDFLYDIFRNDFVDNRCYLGQKIYIDPCSNKKRDGKEKIFWHVITKQNSRTRKREFDKKRACRIKWINVIIENYLDKKIKMFYYFEANKKIRLYLWAYEVDFIVIIQKLGKKSSYLVTSFYIDRNYNKNIYKKRYEDYINRKDIRLNSCEWF